MVVGILGVTAFVYRWSWDLQTVKTPIELTFDAAAPAVQRLYFPAGSRPRLDSITIENRGALALRAPRLIVNEQNRYGSLKEIVDLCSFEDDDPAAVFVCLNDLLHTRLDHLESRHLAKDRSDGFPETVMEALNYYGYSQCGPSTTYLVDLATAMGYRACSIQYEGHIFAQVDLPGGPAIFDPDWGLFYVDDQYRRLQSDEDLRKIGGARRSQHANALLSFIRSGRLAERLFEQKPMLVCGEPSPDGKPWRETPPFALDEFALAPGGVMHFDATWSGGLWGYPVRLEGRLPAAPRATIAFPYPAVRLAVHGAEGTAPSVRVVEPTLPADQTTGTHFDLAEGHLRQTRVFEATVENPGGRPLEYKADLRAARAAIPDLKEGANRFRLDGRLVDRDENTAEAPVVVRLVVETRVNRALDRPLERFRKRRAAAGAP
ncbi:MAG: hypothetical protein H6684_05135 [Deltaproteobacteria bacterium]|nr:hypothetical protein [Deltaproteobacteria bacterium]